MSGLRQLARRQELRAAALTAPAILLLVFTFVIPILTFLYYSIDNSAIPTILPRTITALNGWSGNGMPGDEAYRALAADLRTANGHPALFQLARRLNYEHDGYLNLILSTGRSVAKDVAARTRNEIVKIDPRWGRPEIWDIIAQESRPVTPFFLLSALDLERSPDGKLRTKPGYPLYRVTFARTFWITLIVTGITLCTGFPVAHLIATTPRRVSNWLLYLVLLPFWTSILVRTLAWLIILEKHGLANEILQGLDISSVPIQLIFTRKAVYISMIQILLPFMVISIFSVMRGISPWYMRAATSLGAHPAWAFITVYIPQTLPGVAAGTLLVSVLALGFYITPSLLGGPRDQMVNYYIAFYTNQNVNWNLAAALGTWLLVFSVCWVLLINKLLGARRPT